jgi:hypothetical protein
MGERQRAWRCQSWDEAALASQGDYLLVGAAAASHAAAGMADSAASLRLRSTSVSTGGGAGARTSL